ncbi:MAG: CCA tRNA nucleotidyltransferase [Thermofilum sp. ex4484_82]|nr:MAG: CCA tRNA nucleotidyltransferase [Thermofilum sp. ex4484_82]OYT37709.1 MAG: CCA tRNA nucleotidyltransferase [Archaeoglobales archaeon ex4484_92]
MKNCYLANIMYKDFSGILDEVLGRITPTPEERRFVSKIVSEVITALESLKSDYKIDYKVEIVGSYAKDTWLSGEADIDIFLLFSPDLPQENLGYYGLTIAKKAVENLGGRWFERYATHPYIEAEVKGLTVDIVPAYAVETPDKIISPVDRTPFHTRYVKSRIDEEMKSQIRLLKKFMKGIGVYGAEIKVQGFSGYLAELLIIYYGSFIEVIKNASKWKPRKVFIDLERFYSERERKKLLKIMPGAMVVIDPVDKARNAASALSIQKMCEFVAASKAFFKSPNVEFFFPPKPEIDQSRLENLLKSRETDILAIVTIVPKLAEDIIWGQIYKSLDGLETLFKKYNFKVLSKGAWLSKNNDLVMLYELETAKLPITEKHLGPPVGSENENDFISKYVNSPNTIAGPFIEGSRWIVFRKRKCTTASEVVKVYYEEARLGKHIYESFNMKMQILQNQDILKLTSIDGFKEFLHSWLVKKPFWLKK